MSKFKYLLFLLIVIMINMIPLLHVKSQVISENTIQYVLYTDSINKEDIYIEMDSYELEENIKGNERLAILTLKSAIEVENIEKEQETKFTYNPFEKSNLTIEQYNKILKGTGLEGSGESFYKMEKTYNVNGLFALSVAFHESGLGWKRINTNNCFGMRNNKGWMAFKSVDENIQYFGELMNKSRYKDKDILNIGKVYCPDTYESWASKVKTHMKNNFKKL